MVLQDSSLQTGEGELTLDGDRICVVNYRLTKNLAAADTTPASKSRPQFIGELLLLASSGEAQLVQEAAQRFREFTLCIQGNRQLRIFLVPDFPSLGVFEMLAVGA